MIVQNPNADRTRDEYVFHYRTPGYISTIVLMGGFLIAWHVGWFIQQTGRGQPIYPVMLLVIDVIFGAGLTYVVLHMLNAKIILNPKEIISINAFGKRRSFPTERILGWRISGRNAYSIDLGADAITVLSGIKNMGVLRSMVESSEWKNKGYEQVPPEVLGKQRRAKLNAELLVMILSGAFLLFGLIRYGVTGDFLKDPIIAGIALLIPVVLLVQSYIRYRRLVSK